jgi:adenosylmethionine-8-amino-7-oxononanoate aminotransferase
MDNTTVIGTGIFGQALGGTITGSQNAAMQSAAYNNLLQNVHTTSNPHLVTQGSSGWRDPERSSPSVGINIERASNGYIIRSNGSSIVAMTLEDVQQHVTAIVVSNLVLDVGK